TRPPSSPAPARSWWSRRTCGRRSTSTPCANTRGSCSRSGWRAEQARSARLEGELLAADGGLVHEAALGHREGRHALEVAAHRLRVVAPAAHAGGDARGAALDARARRERDG